MSLSNPSKRKRFLYKRAEFSTALGTTSITLESLLKKSLAKEKFALDRQESINSDDERRLINYHLTHGGSEGNGGIYGCELLSYEIGADQPTIEIEKNATEINVDAIPAGTGKEFVRGTVYFAVKGNHVVLVQSQSLRSIELESHLNWLLRTKSKVLNEETVITLSDHIPEGTKRKIKNVKGIRLTAPIKMELPAPQAAPRDGNPFMVDVSPRGNGWEAFKSMIGSAISLPGNLKVTDLVNIPDLEIKVFLHWKGRYDEDSSDFLDGIAAQMRHIDEEVDYTIESNQGTIGRDQIKIFSDSQIPWTKSGRPKFDVIFPKMAEWLGTLIADKRVDP